MPLDPWGNPYQYACPGTHNPDSYDVWSLGPDGIGHARRSAIGKDSMVAIAEDESGGSRSTRRLSAWSSSLLVLALMAAVAALAWPTVRRQFDNYRLRTAADMMRTEWCLARIEAMRSGCVYTFRNSREGNRFFTQHATDSVPASSSARRPRRRARPRRAVGRVIVRARIAAAPGSPPQQPAGAVAEGASPAAAAAGAELQPGEKLLPDGVDFS